MQTNPTSDKCTTGTKYKFQWDAARCGFEIITEYRDGPSQMMFVPETLLEEIISKHPWIKNDVE